MSKIPGEYIDFELWEQVLATIEVLDEKGGAKKRLLDFIKKFDESSLPAHATALKEILERGKPTRGDKIPIQERKTEAAQMRILRDLLFEGRDRIQFKNDIDLGEDGVIKGLAPIKTKEITVIIAKLFNRSSSYTQKAFSPIETASHIEKTIFNEAKIKKAAKAARNHRKALIKEYLERNNGIVYLPTNYAAIEKTEFFQILINS